MATVAFLIAAGLVLILAARSLRAARPSASLRQGCCSGPWPPDDITARAPNTSAGDAPRAR